MVWLLPPVPTTNSRSLRRIRVPDRVLLRVALVVVVVAVQDDVRLVVVQRLHQNGWNSESFE